MNNFPNSNFSSSSNSVYENSSVALDLDLVNNFIIHQNIRSLRNNFDVFVSHLETLKNLPTIIVLSEIWIYTDEQFNYNIQGYSLISNCNDHYSSGGISVYIKNDFSGCCTSISLN